MVSIQGGSGGGGGFDYVQDPSPQDPQEGEEWYDTGSDRAFVFDGSAWIEQTIGDHGQLSGVGSSDHHQRPTQTQSASKSQAYESYSKGSTNVNAHETHTFTVTPGGDVYDGAEASISQSDSASIQYVDVHFSSGRTYRFSNRTESQSVTFTHPAGKVDSYDIVGRNDYDYSRDMSLSDLTVYSATAVGHSHSI